LPGGRRDTKYPDSNINRLATQISPGTSLKMVHNNGTLLVNPKGGLAKEGVKFWRQNKFKNQGSQ